MEPILNNPGFQHIGESIFMLLDHNQLQSSRLVNHSWNNFLNKPRFWFKKCIQNGLSKELQTEWNKLIQMLQGTNLEQKLTLCLMKMLKEESSYFTDPLVWASKVGDLVLVQFMLKHKELFQYWINYAIRVAAIYGQTDVVKALVACTDNPNAPDDMGWTPILLAANKGHTEVVKFLVNCMDNPNAPDNNENTPMHFAVMNGHTEVVKVLVSCINNPNAPGNNGATPMHYAVIKGHTEIVKLLVDCTGTPDNNYELEIQMAANKGHTEIVNFFKSIVNLL